MHSASLFSHAAELNGSNNSLSNTQILLLKQHNCLRPAAQCIITQVLDRFHRRLMGGLPNQRQEPRFTRARFEISTHTLWLEANYSSSLHFFLPIYGTTLPSTVPSPLMIRARSNFSRRTNLVGESRDLRHTRRNGAKSTQRTPETSHRFANSTLRLHVPCQSTRQSPTSSPTCFRPLLGCPTYCDSTLWLCGFIIPAPMPLSTLCLDGETSRRKRGST